MEAKLQRRVQRYGWDLAADDYEPLWQAQLASAQTALLAMVDLTPGEQVLDVACGTGLVSFAALNAVGAKGQVLGVDLSSQMVQAAQRKAARQRLSDSRFERMDAEALTLPSASFDVALCALGLMYLPNPAQAVREMRRVLRPGGRIALAVWGERTHCGWADLFPIIDAEVASEVCPLFFSLGRQDSLARLCVGENFEAVVLQRITATLDYADAHKACDAAFAGGPVALAWSRFDDEARARVRTKYLASIAPWRNGLGYKIPAEFVVVSAVAPG
jgi:ubiquinone/menaquinone biosynthesis C-methylase UbiE